MDSQTKGAAEEIIGKASSAIIGHDVDTELAAQSQGAQIENAADITGSHLVGEPAELGASWRCRLQLPLLARPK